MAVGQAAQLAQKGPKGLVVTTSPEVARFGWESDFPTFSGTEARVVRVSLQEFLDGAGELQVIAWDESIPKLQTEVTEILAADAGANEYTAILEYELPLELRRPDVVLLVSGAVVVLELKGKEVPEQADLDQAAAYARDLRCYHKHCADREVHAVVVPTLATGYEGVRGGVHVAGPDALHELVQQLQRPWEGGPVSAKDFLARDAYCPLPTLVQAARELFLNHTIRPIHRARALTDPAVDEISRIAHQAAQAKSRHLVLLSGVPGSGKTLVGLRAVHSPALSDLAVARADGAKPTAPGIFLSGNGPLVQVLQYELRSAGGGGKAFVRDVLNYVTEFANNPQLVPPQHVIVYDEAQRAWDLEKVAARGKVRNPESEPELFVNFGERIPEWCVLIGLIGSGQEIHDGEEAGLGQWRLALEASTDASGWTVHAPQATLERVFADSSVRCEAQEALDLDTELRFHLATELDAFVDNLLEPGSHPENCGLAEALEQQAYHLRMTRDQDVARRYFWKRYDDSPESRFGLLASSRDKSLEDWDVPNGWHSTQRLQLGPWYGEDETDRRSCRHLKTCVTEFGAQGLELDGVLLAWGTDLMRVDERWSDERAKRYVRSSHVKDPFQLRLNSYRVLLTRGRDGVVVFVPPMRELDETAAYLQENGFQVLS